MHPDTFESETALSNVSELPKWCGFLALPRELRDPIYSDLVRAGHVAILRVSQQLHDEAVEGLYKQGIFRISLRTPISEQSYNVLQQHMAAMKERVQNLNIFMEFPSDNSAHDIFSGSYGKLTLDLLRSWQGSGACHLTLIFHYYYGTRMRTEALDFIRTLESFKLVTLKINFVTNYHHMDRRRTDLEPSHLRTIRFFAASLSSSLGAPKWACDPYPRSIYPPQQDWRLLSPFPNAHHLVFHPREMG